MIRTYADGRWQEQERFYEALNLDLKKQSILSFVGGGGKTTAIRRLQSEYEKENTPSIVTTTTHIQRLEADWFLNEPSIEKIEQMIQKYGKVWMGHRSNDMRIKSFSEEFLRQVFSLKHTVFIEADGAKMHPCKAPESHEPVIPRESDMVIVLYGIDAVNRKIKDSCFRPERVAEILDKSVEDILCPSDLATLAASSQGGKKCVSDSMNYQVILNKADTKEDVDMAMQTAEKMAEAGIRRVHVTSNLMTSPWMECPKRN